MEPRNQTDVSEFFLLGLTDDRDSQPLIYSVFLSIYLVTILGNLLIILDISLDSHLHTPRYLFLSNLSFNDIFLCTTIVPKMLVIQTQDQSITYTDCLTQFCFVLIFTYVESFLLAVMAYECYVHSCITMVLFSLVISLVFPLVHTLMVLCLSFCTDLEIPYFCELAQILTLACSDALIDNLLLYVEFCLFAGIPLCGIILSYIYIVSTILRIPLSKGRYKAFSTCGSHLSVVSLFYRTDSGVYINSAVSESTRKVAVASVMYLVVPQMLNTFIHCLRTKT